MGSRLAVSDTFRSDCREPACIISNIFQINLNQHSRKAQVHIIKTFRSRKMHHHPHPRPLHLHHHRHLINSLGGGKKICDAESGTLLTQGVATGRQADSPFEIQMEAVLQAAGFQTERQIGVAGYFIDLAVKNPRNTGRFALGIECDGSTYHSSRAARDRDRLREKVLHERGWKLYRIWSTDWFVKPFTFFKKPSHIPISPR